MASNSNEELRKKKQSEKSSYETSKSNKEWRYNNNNKKLERLRKVRDSLKAEKANANSRYKGLKTYVENTGRSTDWTGDKASKAVYEMNDIVNSTYKAYVTVVDGHLDDLCDEITRLENENLQLKGDILRLGSLINSLANEIKKLFN